ncbi:DUF1127 domain-containing protein [Malonomonas rubra]|uniref:DUF1127 domain-containing protein n=1 Tax=Malonomonas rubra TaxID=57040 RepID=UPI0026EA0076|nr:DUF1127 domain-containing protein [Malonomonas rubra]
MIANQCQQQCMDRPVYGFWQSVGRLLQTLGKRIELSAQLVRQRRQLLEMDDRMLKDIGLSRADAEQIAGGHLRNDSLRSELRDRLYHRDW